MASPDNAGTARKRTLYFVTGLSGAGKSTALDAFEDLGFHTVDNLPLTMVAGLLDYDLGKRSMVIGLDCRTLAFSAESFTETVQTLRERDGVSVQVLLMEASDASLIRRFSETRRRHPMTSTIDGPGYEGLEDDHSCLNEAIQAERKLMRGIRPVIDAVVDTSDRTSHETRNLIRDRYGKTDKGRMAVSVISFGYSLGLPNDADMVFDVRFLRNPHYVTALESLTGLSADVANYVRADESFLPFINRVEDMLAFLMPRNEQEGKSYFTLAFGCTGGKHRSVTVAEHIAKYLAQLGFDPIVSHRNVASDTNRRLGEVT